MLTKLLVNTGIRGGCRFSSDSVNVRISYRDPITQDKTDSFFDRYGHLIRAFVFKRRILRSQIWPKMHIIDPVPVKQQPHLEYQTLPLMKKTMRQQVMEIIAKKDPSQINSSFVISIFCQDSFKQMMDKYTQKVLVCGKAPSNEQQYKWIQDRVKELYRIYYFGQKNTLLQKQLQIAYLRSKQNKHLKYERKRAMKKKENRTCIWTQTDQRLIQEKQNWRPTDPTISDIDYRTFFQPLNITQRLPARIKYMQLIDAWSFWDRLTFKWSGSKYFDPTSPRYYQWVQQKLFLRVFNHVKSMQFASNMNIPHDYMIDAMMFQIHMWLLINRLKQINTRGSKILARQMNMLLQVQMVRNAQSVNLKKSNALKASLQIMLETNHNMLEVHFNRSQITKNNHYKGIDGLVWSIAFAEKVHRYCDQVYLFSDYLVKNFEHLERHTQEQILNGIIEFDVFLVDPRYREKIQKINPPLSTKDFQTQFNSNEDKKDYYYSNIQAQDNYITQQSFKSTKKFSTKFTFRQLLQPFINLQIKYLTLKTMDHYNRMQDTKKQNEELDKKGTWKSQKDVVSQVDEEFASLKSLKNKRRELNNKDK